MLMELCIVSRWHCVVTILYDTMIERQVQTYDVKNDNIICLLCFIYGFEYAITLRQLYGSCVRVWLRDKTLVLFETSALLKHLMER
jgi:hypothetical protein